MRTVWLLVMAFVVACVAPVCAAEEGERDAPLYEGKAGPKSGDTRTKPIRIGFDGAEIVEVDSGVIMVPAKLFADWLCAAAANGGSYNVTADGGPAWGDLALEAGGTTHTLNMTVGKKTARVDSRTVQLDAAPIFLDNRVYAPLSVLSTLMGANASTISPQRTVTVTLNGTSGYIRLNSERIPRQYNYTVYKAIMGRQEMLGDRAKKAGRTEEAESRYSTALRVAEKIVSKTLRENALWCYGALVKQSESSYLRGDYEGAASALRKSAAYENKLKAASKTQMKNYNTLISLGEQTEKVRKRLEQKRAACSSASP